MNILAVTNMYPTPLTPASGTFIEQQIKGLLAIGVSVDVLFVNRLREGMRAYLSVGQRVQRRLAHEGFDLVHVMYGGIMAAQITRTVRKVPVVVTFHGSDLLGEHLSGRVRECIATVGVMASRQAARQASAVIVVSRNLEAALAGVERAKLSVVPCGIDVHMFRQMERNECRRRLGWTENGFHVLFPANDGNAVKRPALAKAAVEALHRLGIAATLHHLKGVPYDDVPVWLNASDVLLMTSLHEGSPTIVKEALACGVPIVSVDVGDVREQIAGVDGCFVSAPDPEHLAASMLKVHAGPRRTQGRQRVLNLSLECIAHQLARIYADVLRRTTAEPLPPGL